MLSAVDPARALLVVQCSARKAAGGRPPKPVPPVWPAALYAARERLRVAAGVDDRLVVPAWRRYTGGFYTAAGSAVERAVRAGAPVVIISGGYGILRAEEPIGRYERVFRCSDWPSGLLPSLLAAEADRVGAQAVVAFAAATTDYARLVRQVSWRNAEVATALLVSVTAGGGGAMVRVPRALGEAFAGFWDRRPDGWPAGLSAEALA